MYDSRYIFCLQIDVKISLVSSKNTIYTTKLRKMISCLAYLVFLNENTVETIAWAWTMKVSVYLQSKICKQKLSFVSFVQPGQFDIWDTNKTHSPKLVEMRTIWPEHLVLNLKKKDTPPRRWKRNWRTESMGRWKTNWVSQFIEPTCICCANTPQKNIQPEKFY